MREASATDEVGDRDAVWRDGRLGEKAQLASGFLRLERSQLVAVEQDGPGARAQQPGESAQQGGLAARVRSDDDRERVVRNLEGQLGDDGGVSVAQRDVASQQRSGHGCSFQVRRAYWAASSQAR